MAFYTIMGWLNKFTSRLGCSMNNASEEKVAQFQSSILDYWQSFGRHDLPWRLTRDPWQLLLAEVLLRKTTSAQAVEVFLQLKSRPPEDVSSMDTGELEELLKPLGLHRVRAEQLKTIAGAVTQARPEMLQSDEFWRSLPGIGRYISNSIRCCAFGQPAPALDTNMIRVIQRVFGRQSEYTRPRDDKKLWAFAESLIPEGKCREFNWGVLDFGAFVCTHRKPRCADCLLNAVCDYYQSCRSQQPPSSTITSVVEKSDG